jgi:putative transposase
MSHPNRPSRLRATGLSFGAVLSAVANRVENSHLPFRRRERAMLRFRQMKSLQKFASVHANLQNHFNQERHLVSRHEYKLRRAVALVAWQSLMA